MFWWKFRDSLGCDLDVGKRDFNMITKRASDPMVKLPLGALALLFINIDVDTRFEA